MQSTATPSAKGNDTYLPIACIDAQDEPSVLPLREYLESHAVEVFVNKVPDRDVTYHIVMGDSDFVKLIFSRKNKRREKGLAIVVGYPDKDTGSAEYQSKIIFIDPKELSRDNVMDIFDFFFTSEKNSLDLRAPGHSRIVHEKQHRESPAPEEPDRERINTIIADVFGDSVKPDNKKKQEQSRRGRKKGRRLAIISLLGIGLLIIPTIWYLIALSVSGVALAASARAMTTGNTDAVSWQSRVATYWTGQGSIILKVAAVPLTWAGAEEFVRGQERLLSFFSDAEAAVGEVQSMLGVGKSVASGLLNQVDITGSGTTPAADITRLRISLDSVQNTLGLAQAELVLLLKERTFPFAVPAVARTGTSVISQLSSVRDSAATMDELVSLFLQLAGFREARTYLILLQNSNELRPTGGFIGSVAVSTFEDGRMTDLSVQDVYTFDGQLKGHVDPPVPVRELLGQEHWYLRDSNWDPDFAVSAARAVWFYQKETGSSVDGVLAINTPFIVEVLKATGPIDLPDYNDRITADNFYGKSLYYTQNDFFPGSTQKKDFLGTLARALITKITTSRTTNMAALFRAIATSLTGHDILMMFGSPDLESVVAHYGWAGRVPSVPGCIGAELASCTMDPLVIVEANMGVNKANYFVSHMVDRQVTVRTDGSIKETVIVTEKNTSSADKGLPYRTYLRFLLPADGAVSTVTLDAVAVPSRKSITTAPSFPYFERTQVTPDSYALGIGMDVPAGSQKQLSITYTRENVVRFGAAGAVVDFFVQKQPGVSATPVHTVLLFPAAWTAGLEEQASGTGDFIANRGQLEYNTVLNRDVLTRIRFTK
jgi:Protein of unknown function (DUF4012)